MAEDELIWMGAAELGRMIASGELTSFQVTSAYLDRISAVDPKIESYVTVAAERALAEARARDAEQASGLRRGPLHGVPYCLKDVIATAGLRTTAGSSILADWVPDEDANVVERLTTAGAVLLGKVNTHEFAFGVSSQNLHARTRNPWDRARIAGGSSGGSGAALAAGLAAFSVGTDTAGSIRIPAAFCGVAGLKPTYGLVSATGVVAQSYTCDHIGPLARTVEDLAVVLNAVAGYDPDDPHSLSNLPPTAESPNSGAVSGLRIGVPRELMDFPLEAAVARAFETALETLRSLGAELQEVSLPLLARAATINRAVVLAETAAQHLHWADTWFAGQNIGYGDDVAALLAQGRKIPASDFILASRERRAMTAGIADLFAGKVDLLVTPTVACAAPRAGETTVELAGRGLDLMQVAIHYLCPFSLAGVPALALPAGFDDKGMPVSVQIIGPRLGDYRVLAAGRAFERAQPRANRRPQLGGEG